ncbi:MAG: phospholipase D-like domain-containing protein [Acidobacteriota bacterium]
MNKKTRELIVMPDDGVEAVLQVVAGAEHSLDIKMFLYTEPSLLAAVIEAYRRGVKTRIMLNPARRSGKCENDAARAALTAAGIKVKDTNPDFAMTHEKSMIVDRQSVFIKTLNWAPKHFVATRDFAVLTSDLTEVSEALACFEADWNRTKFEPGDSNLIWCPGNGREKIAHFIDEARHELLVQNERYQDLTIVERLVRAKARGVKVHVMTLPPHTLKEKKLLEGVNGLRIMHDVGIKIHKLKDLHLHAKILVADGDRAIVGSINLAPGSFDERRELAIELDDHHIVKRLKHTFEKDWENSHRLDLSDEGIERDLERHGLDDGGSLALNVDGNRRGRGETLV